MTLICYQSSPTPLTPGICKKKGSTSETQKRKNQRRLATNYCILSFNITFISLPPISRPQLKSPAIPPSRRSAPPTKLQHDPPSRRHPEPPQAVLSPHKKTRPPRSATHTVVLPSNRRANHNNPPNSVQPKTSMFKLKPSLILRN